MNLRLDLEYDGSAFRGWARQPGLRTLEGELAGALDACYDGWRDLFVAGRTDTGVHALCQVASVRVLGGPPPIAAPLVLNAALPRDLAVLAVRPVPEDFHARHSARARAYVYRVVTTRARPVLDVGRVLHHPRALDVAVLDQWAAAVVGTHDFRAFTPTETQHVDFVRTVLHASWRRHRGELQLLIIADRFLRHMVRTLVGTMLQAARGDPTPAPGVLLGGSERPTAGATAAAAGLYFLGARYVGDPDGAELGLLSSGPSWTGPEVVRPGQAAGSTASSSGA